MKTKTFTREVIREKLKFIKETELLNNRELAKYLSVSPTTLQRLLDPNDHTDISYVIRRRIRTIIDQWESENESIFIPSERSDVDANTDQDGRD